MTPHDFSPWLQGHYDMGGVDKLWSPDQTLMIERHLELAFSAGPSAIGPRPQPQFCRWLSGTMEARADLAVGPGLGSPLDKLIGERLESATKAATALVHERDDRPLFVGRDPSPPHSMDVKR